MKRKLIIDKYMISTSNWVLMETLIFDWLTRQRLHVYTFWRAGNSKIWVWNAACIVFTILRTFTLCISCTVLYCSVHITHLSPKMKCTERQTPVNSQCKYISMWIDSKRCYGFHCVTWEDTLSTTLILFQMSFFSSSWKGFSILPRTQA